MDDFISSIVEEFNCKPKYIKKLKYMYICYTDKGTRLVKPISNSIENINFIHKIKTHLKEQNFNNIDFYYITNKGLPYVVNDDINYVMTDYKEFQECDFKKEEDILKSVKCIASFHKLSQFSNINFDTENIEILNIKSNFEKKLNTLKKLKKNIAKQKMLSDFDVSFIKNYDYFYQNAFESINILENYDLDNLKNQALKNGMICHNKLKEESLLLNNHNMFLFNMEYISINHFINDLYMFLIRYIRKHESNSLNLETILNQYNNINNIEKNILPILYAMLLFPERYIKTCETFYERKRSFTPISISSQLENILFLKQYHKEFISFIKPN